jgi:hypothetical protein
MARTVGGMTDRANAEPDQVQTLEYACGCVDRWLTWRELSDGAVLRCEANCRSSACMTCNGTRACPHRQTELSIAEAAVSLQELAESVGAKPRRKRAA